MDLLELLKLLTPQQIEEILLVNKIEGIGLYRCKYLGDDGEVVVYDVAGTSISGADINGNVRIYAEDDKLEIEWESV